MKRVWFLIMVAVLTCKLSMGQLETEKANFLYSLIKYIEWPEEINHGSFKIGVYGSFKLYKEISEVTMGQKVDDLNIEVLNISRPEDIKLFNLHVLMIEEVVYSTESFKNVISYTGILPTLIVGNNDKALKDGASMSFVVKNNKLNFRMNEQEIYLRRIKTSNFISVFTGK